MAASYLQSQTDVTRSCLDAVWNHSLLFWQVLMATSQGVMTNAPPPFFLHTDYKQKHLCRKQSVATTHSVQIIHNYNNWRNDLQGSYLQGDKNMWRRGDFGEQQELSDDRCLPCVGVIVLSHWSTPMPAVSSCFQFYTLPTSSNELPAELAEHLSLWRKYLTHT